LALVVWEAWLTTPVVALTALHLLQFEGVVGVEESRMLLSLLLERRRVEALEVLLALLALSLVVVVEAMSMLRLEQAPLADALWRYLNG
jgi:hypothetical protein